MDPHTGEEKIKIYYDEQGRAKGDCLVCYAKEESIDLAMELLNTREIREGFMITIEKVNEGTFVIV